MTITNNHLQVVLGANISPPSQAHHLLVAFRFGSKPDVEDHPAVADTYLDPVLHDRLYECWWIKGPVTYRREGNIRIAECADYSVVIQDNDEKVGDDFEMLTRQAYVELIAAVNATDHKRLAKVWNYLGGINDGEGDLERYRRFSIGRAAAFSELSITDDAAPTGTGVGTRRDLGLTIIALASKHPLQLARTRDSSVRSSTRENMAPAAQSLHVAAWSEMTITCCFYCRVQPLSSDTNRCTRTMSSLNWMRPCEILWL